MPETIYMLAYDVLNEQTDLAITDRRLKDLARSIQAAIDFWIEHNR